MSAKKRKKENYLIYFCYENFIVKFSSKQKKMVDENNKMKLKNKKKIQINV